MKSVFHWKQHRTIAPIHYGSILPLPYSLSKQNCAHSFHRIFTAVHPFSSISKKGLCLPSVLVVTTRFKYCDDYRVRISESRAASVWVLFVRESLLPLKLVKSSLSRLFSQHFSVRMRTWIISVYTVVVLIAIHGSSSSAHSCTANIADRHTFSNWLALHSTWMRIVASFGEWIKWKVRGWNGWANAIRLRWRGRTPKFENGEREDGGVTDARDNAVFDFVRGSPLTFRPT